MSEQERQFAQTEHEWLAEAAQEAVAELGLSLSINVAGGPPESAIWCIEFSDNYQPLCATFHDEDGLRYADDHLIATIKEHIASELREGGVR